MGQSKSFPAWIGIACTWIGAAVGIFAVTAMAAGLKATISPEPHDIVVFKGILGTASIVALGLSAGLMFSGAWLGRRRKREIAEQQLIAERVPGSMTDDRQQKEPVGRELY
jgi:hypothetical protein